MNLEQWPSRRCIGLLQASKVLPGLSTHRPQPAGPKDGLSCWPERTRNKGARSTVRVDVLLAQLRYDLEFLVLNMSANYVITRVCAVFKRDFVPVLFLWVRTVRGEGFITNRNFIDLARLSFVGTFDHTHLVACAVRLNDAAHT